MGLKRIKFWQLDKQQTSKQIAKEIMARPSWSDRQGIRYGITKAE
jgi:hypothetical protein